LLRQVVWLKIRDNNVISGHYKHVDGTSFAAPIVSSIAAQILEATPELNPHEVKLALIITAVRLGHVDVDRQGWGMVNPRAAIAAAMEIRGRARQHQAIRRLRALMLELCELCGTLRLCEKLYFQLLRISRTGFSQRRKVPQSSQKSLKR
jgi:hypothetical protein